MTLFNTFFEGRFRRSAPGAASRGDPPWWLGLLQRVVQGVGDWWADLRPKNVLPPYIGGTTLGSLVRSGVLVLVLSFFCLAYGFFFGLTAPYLIVPFMVPIAILALMVIWALPDMRRAPTYPIEFLFPASLIALVLWPDYVAVSLPGMPWITINRLLTFPMAAMLLISLSVSQPFRSEMWKGFKAVPSIGVCLVGFIIVQVVTLGFSKNPFASLQGVAIFQTSCTAFFLIAMMIFRKTLFVERYLALLCVLGLPLAFIGLYEGSREHVLWAGHIPSFLRIPDPSVERMLSPSIRMYIDKYRVKATFRSPLALAEYISLLTPFLLHFAMTPRPVLIRAACFALLPLNFILIRATDARLGIVGMLVTTLMYLLLWSINRWRRRPGDLFAAALVFGYPALFTMATGLIFASHRLHAMVLGDGAQAGSTAARSAQLSMAIPKVLANPFGYGSGQCGWAMGFAAGDFVTIDNYFITLVLDHGVLGVLFWYGMFVIAILTAIRYSLSAEHAHKPEARWLAALAATLTAFLIVKWVHGQSDNHTIYFALLGMVCALVYRIRTEAPAAPFQPNAFVGYAPAARPRLASAKLPVA